MIADVAATLLPVIRPASVTPASGTERHRMNDPSSSMSPAGMIVMAVVVLVFLAGWLAAVFLAGREPGGSARPGRDSARARRPEAVTHRGDMPAGALAQPPAGPPAGDGTGEPPARDAGQAGQV